MIEKINVQRIPIEYNRSIHLFMDITRRVRKQSRCKRKQVGAIIVDAKHENIIGIGYNGTPTGFDNNCECDSGDTTIDGVIHAEQNALMKLAKSGNSADGSTLYCTLSPCATCAGLIIQAGIKRVIFEEMYRNKQGLEMLAFAGIELIQVY